MATLVSSLISTSLSPTTFLLCLNLAILKFMICAVSVLTLISKQPALLTLLSLISKSSTNCLQHIQKSLARVISEIPNPIISLIFSNLCSYDPLTGTLKPHSNGPLYSNTVIGTLAVDGWAVTFGTARRRMGGLGLCPVSSSLYQM